MMKYREPNMVKWVGVRPGHNGEQILFNNSVDFGTVTCYTVPATKILLLTWAALGANARENGNYTLDIRNDGGARQTYLFNGIIDVTHSVVPVSENYNPPIEIVAAWTIRVFSGARGLNAVGTGGGILIGA